MIDFLNSADIKSKIRCDTDYTLEILEETDSTNSYLKRIADRVRENVYIVVADSQTCGRGRMSRSYYSPAGTGIYLSILLKNNLPDDFIRITTKAAVAVSGAIDNQFGVKTEIKWVNDILLDSRKICGILVESELMSGGGEQYIIAGIGINVYPPVGGFPEEIKSKAGYIVEEQKPGIRNRLISDIINRFLELVYGNDDTFFEIYSGKVNIVGKRIRIKRIAADKEYFVEAKVLSLNPDCSLNVRTDDGSLKRIMSGEISLHNKY